MDLSAERWEGLTAAERADAARRLCARLPAGFAFVGVRRRRYAGRVRRVATFERGGAAFVLVPGGPVTLGYDAGRAWEPTRGERRSWRDSADEWGVTWTIQEHIARGDDAAADGRGAGHAGRGRRRGAGVGAGAG